ncbi:MAG TPA: LON peptidase substrate-binding domain-containing protein, partial [Roseiflexaceae bacterium]|nr:LON peptidase substrate-binding domain-containing protein [Roseiflexaceae bacterium]
MTEQNTSDQTPTTADLPLIILDGAVVFPYTVVTIPLTDENEAAAQHALNGDHMVLLVARREDADDESPLELQLHRVGTVSRIEQSGKLPNGTTGIVV